MTSTDGDSGGSDLQRELLERVEELDAAMTRLFKEVQDNGAMLRSLAEIVGHLRGMPVDIGHSAEHDYRVLTESDEWRAATR